jgi:glycosyltransferase involved in cell wall biosynthesis
MGSDTPARGVRGDRDDMGQPDAHPGAVSIILVAPNVSEQMGGESMKALQIYLELDRQGIQVFQVTHQRVKPELDRKFPRMRVSYVADGWFQRWIDRTVVLAPTLNLIFQWKAIRQIRRLLREHPEAIVHFTSPVSPVLPYFAIPGAAVIIGPLNGNIHYPPAFRHRETKPYRIRRILHPLLQRLARVLFSGKRNADALLVAGGGRTYQSLRIGGCREAQFVDSIDSGVDPALLHKPRVVHEGPNLRFVHNGRLVKHKGTDLAIRALARTRNPVVLEIIGRGPELAGLKALTAELGLDQRVKFIEWFADHDQLAAALREYRGFVFPSLCEANGIVVQEAMIMGLPVICADWGGPSLLVTPQCGFLIPPRTEEYMIDELAKAMDILAQDGALADRMSIAGRQRAIDGHYLWPGVVGDWMGVYRNVAAKRFGPRPAAADGADPDR